MIKEYKFGLIVGFIFGVLSIFLAALGLISNIAGLMGLIFRFPGPLIAQSTLIQTGPNSYSSAVAMPLALLLNGIFYSLIGGLLQKWFKKKKYVILTFAGVVFLFILAIIIETVIRTSAGLPVRP